MRALVATAYLALSASFGSVAFSQEVPVTRERPKVTAAFRYRLDDRREIDIRQLVGAMEVRADAQRTLELKTLNQSPVTTVLDLTRFLTGAPYKRADGSPLIDLTF